MSKDRATCWSVTINNPTQSDDEWIALAQQKSGWKVYGQREKGAEGTEHYQLMVTTPQVRFSAMKKAFPRGHIEIARDRVALSKYVQKSDTKIGDIESVAKYPSMSQLMSWYGQSFEAYGLQHDGVDDSEFLKIFDLMCNQKIREGYVVEFMAINPQVRSAVKKFGRSINFRERVRRQTDRQTAVKKVSEVLINAEETTDEETEEE